VYTQSVSRGKCQRTAPQKLYHAVSLHTRQFGDRITTGKKHKNVNLL